MSFGSESFRGSFKGPYAGSFGAGGIVVEPPEDWTHILTPGDITSGWWGFDAGQGHTDLQPRFVDGIETEINRWRNNASLSEFQLTGSAGRVLGETVTLTWAGASQPLVLETDDPDNLFRFYARGAAVAEWNTYIRANDGVPLDIRLVYSPP